MTEFVRAKDPETGHEVTVTRQFAEGYNFDVLTDKAAVDGMGRPLPSKPKVNLEPAAKTTNKTGDKPTNAASRQNGDESK